MSKFSDIGNAPMEPTFATAPPSYEEAMLKQPAFNPHVPYNPVTTQLPLQAAPAMQQPMPAYQPAVPPQLTIINVGPSSANMMCPHCHKRIRTRTTSSVQKTAHIAALILCFFGCWLCCCIPYCISSFQDVHHKCPECKAYIGTYKH